MSREKLEQELRDYFKGDVRQKEPPQEWWNKIILSAAIKKPNSHTAGLTSRIKTGIYTIRGFLASKQPVWRTALFSIIAIVLVATLSLTIPLRTVPASAELSDEALALYIAQNSDILVDAAGGAEEAKINEISISYINVEDKEIWVEILGTTPSIFPSHSDIRSWRAEIQVDLLTETIKLFHFMRDNITDGEKAQIQDILNADPRTKSLLDEGAVIAYEEASLFMGVIATGEYTFNETTGKTEIVQAMKNVAIGLDLGEEHYGVQLDLAQGVVVNIGDSDIGLFSIEEVEEIKDILKADSSTRALLNDGAVITHIGTFVFLEVGQNLTRTRLEVGVALDLEGTKYHARVDVINARVVWVSEVGTLEYRENRLQETIIALNEILEFPNLPEDLRAEFLEKLENLTLENITDFAIGWGGYSPE